MLDSEKITHKQSAEPRIVRAGWRWIPSLYLAEALPYAVVNIFLVAVYALRGVSSGEIAFWTSLLGLPWVLKPLWSPFLEKIKRLPLAIVTFQVAIAGCFFVGGVGMLQTDWFGFSLVIFAIVGFFSATHDVVADGFYIRTLEPDAQAFFSGVRNTFYRLGLLSGGSLLLIAHQHAAKWPLIGQTLGADWLLVFFIIGALMLVLAGLHVKTLRANVLAPSAQGIREERGDSYFKIVFAFFKKKSVLRILFFILGYRFAEALLLKISPLFMLADREKGGLGLDQTQYSLVYGTLGLCALLAGGIVGGWLISRKGLQTCFWPMVLALNLTDLLYVYLAYDQPSSLSIIGGCVMLEQFSYGFGFTAFMVYLLYVARGKYPVAHYALCTAFMSLGILLPGLFSGYLAQDIGFFWFFVVVVATTPISFLAVYFAPLSENYGKRGHTSADSKN